MGCDNERKLNKITLKSCDEKVVWNFVSREWVGMLGTSAPRRSEAPKIESFELAGYTDCSELKIPRDEVTCAIEGHKIYYVYYS